MAAAIRPPLRLVLIERSDGYAAVVASLLAAEPAAPVLARFAGVDDALRHIAREDVDCVLLDADQFDGAAGILRIAPAMPIVALTPHADEEEAVRLLRAGAQDQVVKGTESGARLLRAARHAIERRRTGERHQVERLVREVVDEVGRFPERLALLRRRRRDALAGGLALAAGAALQALLEGIPGLSVGLVLPVAFLAARVGVNAALLAAAVATVSAGFADPASLLIRTAVLTVTAVVVTAARAGSATATSCCAGSSTAPATRSRSRTSTGATCWSTMPRPRCSGRRPSTRSAAPTPSWSRPTSPSRGRRATRRSWPPACPSATGALRPTAASSARTRWSSSPTATATARSAAW